MTTRIISGTIIGGYTLSSQYNVLSIASTGEIRGGTHGVLALQTATVINDGTIINSSGSGVDLKLGGSVVNGSSKDSTAFINQGINILNAAGTVSNFGTINAGKSLPGVYLGAGGTVTNGSRTNFSASIGGSGVEVVGAQGYVNNFGTIAANMSNGIGVYVYSGAVTNGSSIDGAALITGGLYGVSAVSATTVDNFGTIAGMGGIAVEFGAASDRLILEAGSSLVGAVEGGGGALQLASGAGTLSGLGTSFSGFGYYLINSDGSWTLAGANTLGAATYLTNRGTLTVAGMVSDSGSFLNLGTVSGADGATGGAGGLAIQFTGGSLNNKGGMTGGAGGGGDDQRAGEGGAGGAGIQMAGGALTNSYTITGGAGGEGGYGGGDGAFGGTGVQMAGGAVTNSGTVIGGAGGDGGGGKGVGAVLAGVGGVGVYLSGAGSNTNKGLIEGGAGGGASNAASHGGAGGVALELAGGALTNTGAIVGGVGGAASGGNNGGAGGAGAYVSGGGQLTNKGQIAGGQGVRGGAVGVGVVISGPGTLDNFGVVTGGVYSVVITSTRGVFQMESGSALIGAVEGGGGKLSLATGSGVIMNLGATGTVSGAEAATFSDFGSYQLGAGTSWTLAGNNNLAAGVTLTVNGKATSTGALSVSGTIGGAGFLTISGGTATFGAGAALTVANFTLAGGTATFGPGATVTAANLTLTGGSAILNQSLTYGGALLLGQAGVLTFGQGDALMVSGPSNVHGLIDGAGTLTVSDGSIGGLTISGTDVLVVKGNVTQTGAVTVGVGDGSASGLVIAKGGVWSIASAAYILHSSASSTLDVEGTLVDVVAGGTAIQVLTIDQGLIEAATGTLALANTITGSGVLQIDPGATLRAVSSVASTLTTKFKGAGGTLALRRGAAFASTITNFGAGDTIDLLTMAATSAQLNGSDQLVVMNGSKLVVTLQLSGSYAGQTFGVGSDGQGGSAITVSGGAMIPAFAAAMAKMGPGGGSTVVASIHDDARQLALVAPRARLA